MTDLSVSTYNNLAWLNAYLFISALSRRVQSATFGGFPFLNPSGLLCCGLLKRQLKVLNDLGFVEHNGHHDEYHERAGELTDQGEKKILYPREIRLLEGVSLPFMCIESSVWPGTFREEIDSIRIFNQLDYSHSVNDYILTYINVARSQLISFTLETYFKDRKILLRK